MGDVKAYKPPEGAQNVHQKPYRYNSAQGAHRINGWVIYGPDDAIVTGVKACQEALEKMGLEETDVPDDVDTSGGNSDADDEPEEPVEITDTYPESETAIDDPDSAYNTQANTDTDAVETKGDDNSPEAADYVDEKVPDDPDGSDVSEAGDSEQDNESEEEMAEPSSEVSEQEEPEEIPDDLNGLNKAAGEEPTLVGLAEAHGIESPSDHTKAELVTKLRDIRDSEQEE